MTLSRRDHSEEVSKLPRNVSQGLMERDNIAKAQGKAYVKAKLGPVSNSWKNNDPQGEY